MICIGIPKPIQEVFLSYYNYIEIYIKYQLNLREENMDEGTLTKTKTNRE